MKVDSGSTPPFSPSSSPLVWPQICRYRHGATNQELSLLLSEEETAGLLQVGARLLRGANLVLAEARPIALSFSSRQELETILFPRVHHRVRGFFLSSLALLVELANCNKPFFGAKLTACTKTACS